jgi:hypothetical protein
VGYTIICVAGAGCIYWNENRSMGQVFHTTIGMVTALFYIGGHDLSIGKGYFKKENR